MKKEEKAPGEGKEGEEKMGGGRTEREGEAGRRGDGGSSEKFKILNSDIVYDHVSFFAVTS